MGIIDAGRLLIAAKNQLRHGAFGQMIQTQLVFGQRTAQRLMEIAADERIVNAAQSSLLPPHWTTIYELHKLDDDAFQEGIQTGVINPDMVRDDAINGARSLMASRVEDKTSRDFFPTPPWSTRALVKNILQEKLGYFERRDRQIVWEPACGEGHMAEVLREYCDDVTASDIWDYGYGDHTVDFLQCEQFNRKNEDADWIITNPPFGKKTDLVALHALKLAKVGVAMFVRLQWLETIGRYETIFRDTPPTLIAFFAERVNLCKDRWNPTGTTATAYIWLVWVKGRQPMPPFWIPPGCRESLSKPDDVERFTAKPVIKKNHGTNGI